MEHRSCPTGRVPFARRHDALAMIETELPDEPRAGTVAPSRQRISLADHAPQQGRLAAMAAMEMPAREDASSHELRSLNVHFGGHEVLEGPGVDNATVGWRAACCCGWRGATVHSRARWPSGCGNAPTSLYEGALHAEWLCHLG